MNAIQQELQRELSASGGLSDNVLTAKELANYLLSPAAGANHTQLFSSRAQYIANTAESDRAHAQWLAKLIIGDLKGLGLPVEASPGELVTALAPTARQVSLRGKF